MYTVINGKWSHLNGETLNPVDITQLSIKIDNMKSIAKITHREFLNHWQEVVEKDYEILSFYNKEGNDYYNLLNDNIYFSRPVSNRNLEYCLKYYHIHSVKRLSDGEIFTISDKLHITFNKPNIIKELISFEITDHLYLKLKDSLGTVITTMNNLEKPKTPLFISEDGVNIFEGDTIFGINTYWEIFSHCSGLPNKIKNWGKNPIFSTKEKTEEYILMNKPCLSYGEVQEYLKVKDCNKVLDLAQSKIQQSV